MTIPANLSFAQAAAIPEAALTSWTNLVVEGGLQKGQTVLITGAASGVGTMAVQMARELGARVLVAGRDRTRLEALFPLGAEAALILGERLGEETRALTGGGVDLVLDLIGGQHLGSHLQALAEHGRLVLVGLMAGPQCQLELGSLLRRRLRLVGSVLRARSREEKAGLVEGFWAFAAERFADGRLRPVVDRVLPWEQMAGAYDALRRGGVFGKVVVEA